MTERDEALPQAAQRRERHTLIAAALTNGPNELVDFILPLWAGASLGLSGTAVGLLMAVEMAVSIAVRPFAGVLADRRERRDVAAVGALLYAVSLLGYAVADGASVAYPAAAIGGAGGALLWVAVRAIASERLAEDSAAFPRLFSHQETGSWVAFVAGMTLINVIDFAGVFLAGAAACALAAGFLLTSPRRRPDSVSADEGATFGGLGAVGRRLRPMLLAVILTMAAESAVGLLLLLHLQRGLGLEIVQIALVFLPGAIVMSAAAPHLHRYVVRYGRSRVLAFAAVCSAAFATGLAWAPNAFVIAALWILSGLSWAAVMPIQQAVIAEASGDGVGRGMGVYESASLIGGLLGALVAGVVYDRASWVVACLIAAATLLAGAVVMPRAVRRLGVVEHPPAPAADAPQSASPAPSADTAPPAPTPPAEDAPASASTSPAPAADDARSPSPEPDESPRTLLLNLAGHAGVFAAAQVVLTFFDLAFVPHLVTDDLMEVLGSSNRDFNGVTRTLYTATKVWAVILLFDVVSTCRKVFAARSRGQVAS